MMHETDAIDEKSGPHIFIVNLARRPDKRTDALRRAAAAGIDVEIIEAVDGIALSNAEVAAVADDWPASRMSKGVVACALSHLQVYKRIIDDDIALALVLEDDALPQADLAAVMANSGATFDGDTPKVLLLSSHYYHAEKLRTLPGGRSLHRFADGSQGHAYMLNKQAAQALYASLQPVSWEADKWWYFQALGYVEVECIVPHTVGVDGGADNSDLQAERVGLTRERRAYLWKRGALVPFRIRLKKLVWKLFRRPFSRKS